VSDMLKIRHGETFARRLDLDVRGHPSQSVVERARNFYLARTKNDDIRSIVIADTKTRMRALLSANTLGEESYLEYVVGWGISWRWFGFYSFLTSIFRRLFYINFFFEQMHESRIRSAYFAILSCCCCWRCGCCFARRRRLYVQ